MNQAKKPTAVESEILPHVAAAIERAARITADRKAKAERRKSPEYILRSEARKAAKAPRNLDVEIVDGDVAPSIQGEPGGYCNADHLTGSGYERSTLRVVVGRDWKASK
jgi:hypothetical protein